MDQRAWRAADRTERLAHVRGIFGDSYEEVPGPHPAFLDASTGTTWVVAPSGDLRMGMSEREERAARRLCDPPYLSMGEMRPVRTIRVAGFLALKRPVSRSLAAGHGIGADWTAGPGEAVLVSPEEARLLASRLAADLPKESEWEYLCRGGTDTLFWFGDDLADDSALWSILGLREPFLPNGFGAEALFFGERCSDPWTASLGGPPVNSEGGVVRGGAGRFWPWQAEGEWAGCVSAFRMPETATGGEGCAVRLVRRPPA